MFPLSCFLQRSALSHGVVLLLLSSRSHILADALGGWVGGGSTGEGPIPHIAAPSPPGGLPGGGGWQGVPSVDSDMAEGGGALSLVRLQDSHLHWYDLKHWLRVTHPTLNYQKSWRDRGGDRGGDWAGETHKIPRLHMFILQNPPPESSREHLTTHFVRSI